MNDIHKSSHSGHAAFVVLVFLLGSIAGYYIGKAYQAESYNQTLADKSIQTVIDKKTTFEPPSNWNQYKSDSPSFSFYYPPELTLVRNDDKTQATGAPLIQATQNNAGHSSFELSFYAGKGTQLTQTQLEETYKNYKNVMKKEMLIDKRKAYLITYDSIGDQYISGVLQENGQHNAIGNI